MPTVKLWLKCLTSARSKDQCGCCNDRKCAAARDILTMQQPAMGCDIRKFVGGPLFSGCLWCYDPKYDWTTWPVMLLRQVIGYPDMTGYMIHDTQWYIYMYIYMIIFMIYILMIYINDIYIYINDRIYKMKRIFALCLSWFIFDGLFPATPNMKAPAVSSSAWSKVGLPTFPHILAMIIRLV